MSPSLVSIFFTVGAGTWLFTKLQKYSGNNTRSSVIATAVAAAIMYYISFTIFNWAANL